MNPSCSSSRTYLNILPPVGILDSDGIPFYHLRRYALKPAHWQRLKECGVKLRRGKFLPEEVERIKENWRNYAEKHNIDYSRAYEFAGGYAHQTDRDERTEFLDFQDRTNFVPEMCKGMNDRLGFQIIPKMAKIFHPCAGNKIKWTPEIEKQFEELYAEGLPSRIISHRIKKPKTQVDYRIQVMRMKEEQSDGISDVLDDSARQTLYDFVAKWLRPSSCPLELQEMLPESQEWNAADFALLEDQEKAMSYLPWISLTYKMRRTVPVIKEFWSKEVKRLREVCERCGGDTEKATSMCIPQVHPISVGEFKRCLELILEQKPDIVAKIDINQLQKRIEDEKLTGYCTNGLIEAEFLRQILIYRINSYVSNRGKYSPRNIPGHQRMTHLDWLKVFIDYMELLDVDSRQWHISLETLGYLIRRQLDKKPNEEISPSSSGMIENVVDKSSSFNHSLTVGKIHKGGESGSSVPHNGPKINNNHILPSTENRRISINRIEYAVEKLKNLIESWIPVFDEHRQQKCTKKLAKIMNRDEKLEGLKELVEKMISNLENEEERKLSKKYRKIMKRFRKMQEAEIDGIAVNQATGSKNPNKDDKVATSAGDPEVHAENADDVERYDFVDGAYVKKLSQSVVNTGLQQKGEKGSSNGQLGRRKIVENGNENLDQSSGLSPVNGPAVLDQEHRCKDVNNGTGIEYEVAVEKLKNLIESWISVFDEHRQRKYAKKLAKIMNRDEKLEELQKLVEKMISNLEDEEERKLSKKYRKIMKRFRKIQDAEIGGITVNGAKPNKDDKVTASAGDPEMNAEVIVDVRRFNFDIGAVKKLPQSVENTELQQMGEKENTNRQLKRRKIKVENENVTLDKSPGLSHLNGATVQRFEDAQDNPSAKRRKTKSMTGNDAISSFLNLLKVDHHSRLKSK